MGWLKAFIPQHLSNERLLDILDILTYLKISKRKIRANRGANAETLIKAFSPGERFYARGKHIENQPQWKRIRFGRFTMDYSGCEIIATYNAILSLGETLPEQGITDLIGVYEKKGAVLWGGWGVAPRAICRYFMEKGYDAAMTCSTAPEDIDRIGEEYKTVIITVYNDARDITKQIHTMNVSKAGQKDFVLHNCYRRDRDGSYIMGAPHASLWETIRSLCGGKAKPICIIGINPRSPLQKALRFRDCAQDGNGV